VPRQFRADVHYQVAKSAFIARQGTAPHRPQLRLHGIFVAFGKNHGKRVITITKTNRPKNLPSRLSNNLIGYCDADSFEEEKSPET